MSWQIKLTGKHRFWLCIPFLMLSFLASAGTVNNAAPPAGGYCPGEDILHVTAEGLSASLNLAMKSRAALVAQDRATALNDLDELGTTLNLASSRGAAARTVLLIDAIIAAKSGEDYSRMLDWLPLLKTSLVVLPDDPIVRASDDWITSAEAIMRGDENGNPLMALKQARHLLACDSLDIPLHKAIRSQTQLIKRFGGTKSPDVSDYDTLLNSLHDALNFALGNKIPAPAN